MVVLSAALALAAASSSAAAGLYRWVDAEGVLHYTDDRESIPEAYRDRAELREAPGPRTPEAARAPEPSRPGDPARPPAAVRPGDPARPGNATSAPEPSALPSPTVPGIPVPPGGPVIVDAHLNGVPLRLLVDTGADRTVIAPAALLRAGYDAAKGAPVQITGVTGSANAVVVPIQRLDVAGAQVGPLAVIAHPVPGDGIDGLLGRDVLDGFTVTFDSAANRATLLPR